jgi:hypothetical protein
MASVRMADLDEVANVVAAVLRTEQSMMWESKATGYYDMDYKNLGLVGFIIKPIQDLRWLQQGTGEAFTFPAVSGSLYQVGDFGVAQRKLYDLNCC